MDKNDKPLPPVCDNHLLALPTSEPSNSTLIRNMDGTRLDQRVESTSDKWRRWRRRMKARLPYVRRREYEIAMRLPDRLMDDVVLRSCASDDVALATLKPASAVQPEEICLFVTHAPRPALKRHVVLHIEHMLDAGIAVILIVNTHLGVQEMDLAPELLRRLHGAYVRENRGYDFAAWSHTWKTTGRLPGCKRLFLVNDSVIGPLSRDHFLEVITRIRSSNADVIGLTEAPEPRLHLQSYFLVVQGRALRSDLFKHLFDTALCLPTKEWVVHLYETRITGYLRAAGLACEALFTSTATPGGYTSNDSLYRWRELIESGCPYIKTRIVTEEAGNPRMLALVPEHLRTGH